MKIKNNKKTSSSFYLLMIKKLALLLYNVSDIPDDKRPFCDKLCSSVILKTAPDEAHTVFRA